MSPPLLHLRDVHVTFGGTPLLRGASLQIEAGDRLCLVGRNGSGKSTLLKIAAGLLEADRGERFVHPSATLRYLPQEPDLSGFDNVRAYVEGGLAPGDDAHRARFLLEQLGLDGTVSPATLSGGEARRAALARVMAAEPDILLLDEPTNHLDLPAIEWLETELSSLRSAIVLISHDRRFLEKLSRATVWLDRGQTRRMSQGFAAFEAWRDDVLLEEERDRQKLDRKIAAEEDWVRYGVTARRKRNVRRMADLEALRRDRRDARRRAGQIRATLSEATESGHHVIEAQGLWKSWSEAPLVAGFSIRIAKGDKIGIVGANGAGKTTLLKLLIGDLAPDRGSVRLGTGLAMVTLDQRRESLEPTRTVADTLTGGGSDFVQIGDSRKHVVGYLRDFLFQPEQARTPVSALSGGERGRLLLARAFAKPSNLLVLDEPTNDLDLETLDLLQEMIADYAGTVLLISHDRDFLDRVATCIVMSEGQGRWLDYAGGYSDMLAQRGRGVEAKSAASKSPFPADKIAEPPASVSERRRKLSFKDKHALETLPAKIAALEAEAARLEGLLADPDLFHRDAKTFAEVNQALGRAVQEKTAAEEEWLRLELLREEMES